MCFSSRVVRLFLVWISITFFAFFQRIQADELKFDLKQAESGWARYALELKEDMTCMSESVVETAPFGSNTWTTSANSTDTIKISDNSQIFIRGEDAHVLGLNPHYSFEFDLQYGLESCHPSEGYEFVFEVPILRECTVLHEWNLVEGIKTQKLFADQGVSVKNVSQSKSKNEELVVVVFDAGDLETDKFNRIAGGEITFLPNRNWVIKSYKIEIASVENLRDVTDSNAPKKWSSNATATKEIRYETIDGHFLPVHQVTTYDCPSPYKKRRYTNVFRDFSFEPISDERFRLTSFGLPEPAFTNRSRRTSKWTILGLVCFIVLVGTLVIRRKYAI